MRRASLLAALGSSLVLVALPSVASAQVNATPCDEDVETCLRGPIHFERTTEVLPIGFDYDTGWIPADSPLQVRLAAGLWSETTVVLDGQFQTTWPEVLEHRAIPTLGGGSLDIHYGAEISADAKFEVEVLGQTFTWEGPIPYVPQFDFQVEQTQPFDPWAFDGFTVTDATETLTLAEVGVGDLIGIPGVDGGFRLDVQLELDATYRTTSIQVQETDGQAVAGGPITAEGGVTRSDYAATPFVEHDVHVEGSLLYEGTLHLIPAFFIEVLGQDFSIPIVDVPVPFSIEDKEWIFDPVRVHTAIPDIELPDHEESATIAFGELEVGEERTVELDIGNLGEHALYASLVIDDDVPVTSDLESVIVVQDGTAIVELTYAPASDEPLDAVLVIVSNDPDEPVRTLSLTGSTVPIPDGSGGGAPTSGAGGEGGADDSGAGGAGGAVEDGIDFVPSGGGCDCTASNGDGSPASGMFGALAIGAVLASRRRRA